MTATPATGTPAPSVSGRGMTMSDLIARYSRTSPEAVAFRDGALTLTWSQTHERITRLASVLAGHGVGAGDRVGARAFTCCVAHGPACVCECVCV